MSDMVSDQYTPGQMIWGLRAITTIRSQELGVLALHGICGKMGTIVSFEVDDAEVCLTLAVGNSVEKLAQIRQNHRNYLKASEEQDILEQVHNPSERTERLVKILEEAMVKKAPMYDLVEIYRETSHPEKTHLYVIFQVDDIMISAEIQVWPQYSHG